MPEPLRGIGSYSQALHADYFGVVEWLGIRFHKPDKSVDQVLRLRTGGTYKYCVPPPYLAVYGIFRREFFGVNCLPAFKHFESQLFLNISLFGGRYSLQNAYILLFTKKPELFQELSMLMVCELALGTGNQVSLKDFCDRIRASFGWIFQGALYSEYRFQNTLLGYPPYQFGYDRLWW